MAITVTTLGTGQAPNSTTVTITGVSASAGEWIFIAFAGDTGAYTVYCNDGAFFKVSEVVNSGNVVTQLWARKLYGAISSATITAQGGADDKAITGYKVFDLDGSANIPDNTSNAGSFYLNNINKRMASVFWAAPSTFTSVTASLRKSGSPTGLLYVRVRDVSDDSIIGTLGSIDVSTLTTSWLPYTFNSGTAVISSNTHIYLSIEYADGTAINYIVVENGQFNDNGQNLAYHNGTSWTKSILDWPPYFTSITGGKFVNPFDKGSTATGTNPPYNTGSTGTLSQAAELGIAVIGIEEETDQLGSWTTGAGYVSGNEQSTGTTSGGAKSISIASAAEVLSATTAQEGDMNAGAPDYAALIATFKKTPDIMIYPSGIASREDLGQPALEFDQTVSPQGIPTAESVGQPELAEPTIQVSWAFMEVPISTGGPGTQTLYPDGIASAESLGAPQITIDQDLYPAGIVSAESLGTPQVVIEQFLYPAGIASGESFGAPQLDLSITAAGAIVSAEALGTAKLDLSISVQGIATAEGWGTPKLDINITAAGGISTAESLGAPQVNLTLQPVGIASAESIGQPQLGLNIFGAGNIASGESLGQPQVSLIGGLQDVYPDGIASAEALGQPEVIPDQSVAPDGIASAESFGTAQLDLAVAPAGIASAESFGQPDVFPDQSLAPDGIASAESFGSPQLDLTILPDGIASAESFGSPQLDLAVLPNGIASGEALGQPQVTPGAVSVYPDGIGSAESLGQPQVSTGATSLYPEGIASGEALGQPQVTLGAVTISPEGIASAEALGSPQVNISVSPEGIASAESFGSPQLDLAISPEGIASAESFGTAQLNLAVLPDGIASAESFGDAQLNLAVLPDGIASAESFGSPQLDLTIAPEGVASAESFGQPQVSAGAVTLYPEGIASAESIGQPQLTPGAVTIAPDGIGSAESFGTAKLGLSLLPAGISSAESLGSPRLDLVVYPAGIASGEAHGEGVILGVARPDGDVSLGGWTDQAEGTTDIYQSIDEPVVSDSDYIQSDVSGTPSAYTCTLSDLTDSGSHEFHILDYRFRKEGSGATAQLVVTLLEGETVIASWTHPDVGGSWTDAQQTLTEGQASSITDYAALRLKFEVVEV